MQSVLFCYYVHLLLAQYDYSRHVLYPHELSPIVSNHVENVKKKV